MEKLKNPLIKIWENEIPVYFKKGILVYERQLQAMLYHHLVSELPGNYFVWVEPVIYDLGKIKPDMIITKDDEVVCIIELKFKPWEYAQYTSDIAKLNLFESLASKKKSINLGIKPVSPIWAEQKDKGNISFRLREDFIKCFIVFARPDSYALKTKELDAGNNFLHLFGYFKDVDNITFSHSFVK